MYACGIYRQEDLFRQKESSVFIKSLVKKYTLVILLSTEEWIWYRRRKGGAPEETSPTSATNLANCTPGQIGFCKIRITKRSAS